MPLLDCEATIAPTISTPQARRRRARRIVDRARSARDAASGITATMFSARSFGFLNMPPTAPRDPAVLDHVDAAAASMTARSAM